MAATFLLQDTCVGDAWQTIYSIEFTSIRHVTDTRYVFRLYLPIWGRHGTELNTTVHCHSHATPKYCDNAKHLGITLDPQADAIDC